MSYLGDFTTSNTVYVYFNTFDSNDPAASVTTTGLAVSDIEIYKDGSTTQRSSDAGYTLLDTDGIDFDGITGIHGFSVDLSDNTDSGFYAAGSEYTIVVSSITVDAATVNFIAGSFSIERAGGALALLKGTNSLATIEGKIDTVDGIVDSILLDTAEIGTAGAGLTDLGGMSTAMKAEVNAEADTALTDYDALVPADLPTNFGDLSITATTGRVDVAAIAGTAQTANDNGADINAILADTNELQTDDIPSLIATAQADLDIITGADGVNLLTATQASIDAIEADTNEMQGDLADGGRLDTIFDATLADTGELQTDWANGGRLDLILDARASQTTADAIETDTQDIQSTLAAGVDVDSIDGSTEAATNLRIAAEVEVTGTAIAGTLSTTQMTTNLTEATDDHYNGRVIIWTSGVLVDQATDITDYTGSSKLITYTAVTEAPSADDTSIIV